VTALELGMKLAIEYEKDLPPRAPANPDKVVTFPGAERSPPASAEPPLDQLLTGYHLCHSHSDFVQWWLAVCDRIIGLASRAANSPGRWEPERAACPLCRSPGWAIPEGPRRHLEGLGNTGECDVARALRRHAANSRQDEFARADQAAQALEIARRRDERTYLIHPLQAPRSLDEPSNFYIETPRTAEQLAAAEERLREFGFAVEADGNVVAWKHRQEPYVVLADPRTAGKLRFRVYDETRLAGAEERDAKRRRRGNDWDGALRLAPLTTEFFTSSTIGETDTAGKFQTRLGQAIATLNRHSAATDRRNEMTTGTGTPWLESILSCHRRFRRAACRVSKPPNTLGSARPYSTRWSTKARCRNPKSPKGCAAFCGMCERWMRRSTRCRIRRLRPNAVSGMRCTATSRIHREDQAPRQ
jgi:hypothetical protein